jgi:hypothetical protein
MAPGSQHESILKFLNSAESSRRAGDTRCACGSTMTKQKTTFFYNGQSWEVIFRICRKCHPAPRFQISYDA